MDLDVDVDVNVDADARLQPSPVFCAIVFTGRFFFSFLLTHVHGALPTRARQIGFLFSDIWNWRASAGDQGPGPVRHQQGPSSKYMQLPCCDSPQKPPDDTPRKPPSSAAPFLLATRIHKSGNLIYATVAHFFSTARLRFCQFKAAGKCYQLATGNWQCSLNI